MVQTCCMPPTDASPFSSHPFLPSFLPISPVSLPSNNSEFSEKDLHELLSLPANCSYSFPLFLSIFFFPLLLDIQPWRKETPPSVYTSFEEEEEEEENFSFYSLLYSTFSLPFPPLPLSFFSFVISSPRVPLSRFNSGFTSARLRTYLRTLYIFRFAVSILEKNSYGNILIITLATINPDQLEKFRFLFPLSI